MTEERAREVLQSLMGFPIAFETDRNVSLVGADTALAAMLAFAAQARAEGRAEEREACAKVADETGDGITLKGSANLSRLAWSIADAIRARDPLRELQRLGQEMDTLAAALVSLAASNIPTDVQELLAHGNPDRGIPPGALARALKGS